MLKNIKKILIKEYRKKKLSQEKTLYKLREKKTQPNKKKKMYGKIPYRKAAEKFQNIKRHKAGRMPGTGRNTSF